jgi:hypothetical protein
LVSLQSSVPEQDSVTEPELERVTVREQVMAWHSATRAGLGLGMATVMGSAMDSSVDDQDCT